ncbi:ankyrin repeat-containing domain protein [Aspergillus stella-maris]|uniref:ankyrin repeat-containing domain protein n=1 Tax=Aspergillus stella-maris TaxID=1810926 RepID=UPI003CCDA7C6
MPAILAMCANNEANSSRYLKIACWLEMIPAIEGLFNGGVSVSTKIWDMPALLQAIREDEPSIKVVRCLLDEGADIAAADDHHEMPLLHWVVHCRFTEILEALLQAGGETALSIATSSGNSATVEVLKRYGESLHEGQRLEPTGFLQALQKLIEKEIIEAKLTTAGFWDLGFDQHRQEVPTRYENGVFLDITGCFQKADPEALRKYNALISACEAGDAVAVKAMVKTVSPNPTVEMSDFQTELMHNRGTVQWYTPLEAALRANSIECLDILMNADADLGRLGFTDIMRYICAPGRFRATTFMVLVRHGLDFTQHSSLQLDFLGETCREVCDEDGLLGFDDGRIIIQFFLDNGLRVDAPNRFFGGTLGAAISKCEDGPSEDNIKLLKFLIETGGGPNASYDNQGSTPLLLACRLFHFGVAQFLLNEFEVNVDAMTNNSWTPLRFAISRDCPELVELLLQRGASLRAGHGARSLFDGALGFGHITTAEILLEAWVNQFGLEDEPDMLLSTAAAMGDIELLQQLLRRNNPQKLNASAGIFMALKFRQEPAVHLLLPYAKKIQMGTSRSGHDSALIFAAKLSGKVFQAILDRACQEEIDFYAEDLFQYAIDKSPASTMGIILDRVKVPTKMELEQALIRVAEHDEEEKFEELLALVNSDENFAEIPVNVLHWSLENLVCGGQVQNLNLKAILTSGRLNMNKLENERIKLAYLAIEFGQSEALDLLLETTSNTIGSALQQVNDYSVYDHGVATAQVNLRHRTDPEDTHYRQLSNFLAIYTGDRSPGGDLNISLLSWASRLGPARTVRTLINKYSVDVNKVDGFGMTALSHAAEQGNVETVSILLKAGAKAEVVDNNGRTPFFLAVTGSLPLEHLEFRSANKDKTFDRTKFRESLDTRRMAIKTATMLLEHGANLHHKDALGRNALSYVAASFLPDLTQFLIDKGIDIDEVDDKGRTALSHACEIGSTEAVRVLIKAGCDVVKADKSERGQEKPIGYTPLQYAEAWDDVVGLIYSGTE